MEMYKLLILLFKLITKDLFYHKRSLCFGLCPASWLIPVKPNYCSLLNSYIKSHKPISFYFRFIFMNIFKYKTGGFDSFYWKTTKRLWLRKWYLIRHIIYCWVWYQIKLLFKSIFK